MTEKINGRPRNDGQPAGKYATTALYEFLSKNLPQFDRHGTFSVPEFAAFLGYTKFHMYRTIESNRLSGKMFTKLVELTDLKKEDLLPFAPKDVQTLLNG